MYIGHKREDGTCQPLCGHLVGTAEHAAAFAGSFGAEKHAYRTALLHDIGKYSPAGQRRMQDPEKTAKVDHATAGAKTAYETYSDVPAAFAIAGHHGGLMNIGTRADLPTDGTLQARLKKELANELDFSAYAAEIKPSSGNMLPGWLGMKDNYAVHFYIRMLYSCLVDADFLDTESFMRAGAVSRGDYASIEQLTQRLMRHISPWLSVHEDSLNGIRSDILRSMLNAADTSPGIYSMTVPTGGGKTISSLTFALNHALRNNKKRIIYVIPYTSIIEQNAAVFSDILGPENIVEHHSNMADVPEDDITARHQLSAENWDAPVVVTTAVQFFESLYSAKTSRCRKLHNIADSVIIFDEAQMIPLCYLRPCVAAMTELVRNYRCTAVLCTATQPALSELIHEFCAGITVREICPAAASESDVFRRVTYQWHEEMDEDALVEHISMPEQVLCIVNTRKSARSIYEALPPEGRFHLSTMMTATHRSRTIGTIRERLDRGLPCRVVSTSLIEAGVDIDFPEVWREEAGLDSVLQAGGRCNREGKRPYAESMVHVFKISGHRLKMIEQNIYAMNSAAARSEYPAAPAIISEYFSLLYRLRGTALDLMGIMDMCGKFRFRDISDSFRIIEDDTIPIYIPSHDNAEDIAAIARGECSRAILRRLGKSCVNVYPYQHRQMLDSGKLSVYDGFSVLADAGIYSEEYGLDVSCESGVGIMI